MFKVWCVNPAELSFCSQSHVSAVCALLTCRGASCFRRSKQVEKLRVEKRLTSFAFFLHCPIGRIERRGFCGGDDNIYSCWNHEERN